MQAGKLNKQIIIQSQSTSQDSFGQQSTSWSTHATIWAKIEPVIGREFFASDSVHADITTKITIRYLSTVVPKMRVSFGSKIYDIKAVINIEERNKQMLLMCSEVVN